VLAEPGTITRWDCDRAIGYCSSAPQRGNELGHSRGRLAWYLDEKFMSAVEVDDPAPRIFGSDFLLHGRTEQRIRRTGQNQGRRRR